MLPPDTPRDQPPAEPKGRKLQLVVTLLVVLALVSVTLVWAWVVVWRPLTMQEVLEHPHWRAGDVRDLEDTIVNVTRVGTNRGTEVVLYIGTP
ncbi:MAG: hypothetical protein AABY30_06245 [Candidatus Thermoplasmatota archaeon]